MGWFDVVKAPFSLANRALFGDYLNWGRGGIIGTPINYILENPGKSALIAVSGVATGGVGAAASSLLAGSASSVAASGLAGLASAAAGSAGTAATIGTASAVAGGAATKSYLSAAALSATGCINTGSGTTIAIQQLARYGLMGFVAPAVSEYLVDNYVRDTVRPVRGSVVYCKLGGIAEHSGIYVGDGKIVHLDGDGSIEVVSRRTFIRRLGGVNPALSIYVSCVDTSAAGTEAVAKRALAMIGRQRKYNVILDNCHQFTSGCLTGNFDNSDNFWWMVKDTAEKKYKVDNWRVWKAPKSV